MNNKFTGICILIGAMIIAGSIFYNACVNRYKPFITNSGRFTYDSLTGTYYTNTEIGEEFHKTIKSILK